jgi:hypothetical protein
MARHSVAVDGGDPHDIAMRASESRHLQRSVGEFVTGVTVVTYEVEGARVESLSTRSPPSP